VEKRLMAVGRREEEGGEGSIFLGKGMILILF
jgi:hypothetical protein